MQTLAIAPLMFVAIWGTLMELWSRTIVTHQQKKWYEIPYGLIMLLSGYVYILNSTGPRTDPWGTPYFKTELSEMHHTLGSFRQVRPEPV